MSNEFNVLKFIADNAGLSLPEAIEKAYNLGKQDGLEHEHILDKIRTEIENHRRKTQYIDPHDLIGDCLDIIDKYVESEDK